MPRAADVARAACGSVCCREGRRGEVRRRAASAFPDNAVRPSPSRTCACACAAAGTGAASCVEGAGMRNASGEDAVAPIAAAAGAVFVVVVAAVVLEVVLAVAVVEAVAAVAAPATIGVVGMKGSACGRSLRVGRVDGGLVDAGRTIPPAAARCGWNCSSSS